MFASHRSPYSKDEISRDALLRLETRMLTLRHMGVIDLGFPAVLRDVEAIIEQDDRAVTHRPGSLHSSRVTNRQAREIDALLSIGESHSTPGGKCDLCGKHALKVGPCGMARCESHGSVTTSEYRRMIVDVIKALAADGVATADLKQTAVERVDAMIAGRPDK